MDNSEQSKKSQEGTTGEKTSKPKPSLYDVVKRVQTDQGENRASLKKFAQEASFHGVKYLVEESRYASQR